MLQEKHILRNTIIALVIIVIGATIVLIRLSRVPAPRAILESSQIDSTANIFNQTNDMARATFGGRIAFGSKRQGDVQIYIMSADGSSITQLAQTEWGVNPAWSPDRKHIAFERVALDSLGNPYRHIYVVDSDGTNAARLTNSQRWDSYPVWSSNGHQIAFITSGDIQIINADGSNETHLTHDLSVNTLAWSPDGQRIAFSSFVKGNEVLYVMHIADSRVIRLTPPHVDGTAPAWSSDGQRIAFASWRHGNKDIYVISADGSNEIRLTDNPAIETNPAWSPDDTQIAFISTRNSSDSLFSKIYVRTLERSGEIWLMDDVTLWSRIDWQL